jgi:thymidylate synthase
MNKLDKDYQALLQDILDNGHQKGDRTGTGTISVFGRQIRHKMSEGFPLLTTKKMYFKGIVTELLWFLRGDTNIKYLVDNDCHIWDGDAYKAYSKERFKEWEVGMEYESKEEFINKIKTDDEFAKKWGELGPVYGKQWREWTYLTREQKQDVDGIDEEICGADMWDGIRHYRTFDQIANLINDLKTNPDSRRLMVNAWNVGELDQMTLPPCHYGFQVYTRELTLKERAEAYNNMLDEQNYKPKWQSKINDIDKLSDGELMTILQSLPSPTRAISLSWNQRSVDTPLGLPFNIASYGLLLEIIGKMVNMVPEELIGNLGDAHIYSNQVEGCIEQIGQPIFEESPTLYPNGPMNEGIKKQIIVGHTREPYPLPKLVFGKTDKFFEDLGNDLSLLTNLDSSDFKIENYQSHPTIKFPLSN